MAATSVQSLEALLARKQQLSASSARNPDLATRLRDLRAWQAARLARTYEDMRRVPSQAAAVEFFLSDLYGPTEFTARDEELSRAWRYLKRSLPEQTLQALGRAIELEVLTADLDHAMAAALPSGPLSDSLYATAYRTVGRPEDRQRQIDLATGAGEDLDRAVRHVWIGAVLKAAHGPAHAAGFGVLQDFLERGYHAFRKMKSARPLLDAIRQRETAIMQALFSGNESPFDVVALEARDVNG